MVIHKEYRIQKYRLTKRKKFLGFLPLVFVIKNHYFGSWQFEPWWFYAESTDPAIDFADEKSNPMSKDYYEIAGITYVHRDLELLAQQLSTFPGIENANFVPFEKNRRIISYPNKIVESVVLSDRELAQFKTLILDYIPRK